MAAILYNRRSVVNGKNNCITDCTRDSFSSGLKFKLAIDERLLYDDKGKQCLCYRNQIISIWYQQMTQVNEIQHETIINIHTFKIPFIHIIMAWCYNDPIGGNGFWKTQLVYHLRSLFYN